MRRRLSQKLTNLSRKCKTVQFVVVFPPRMDKLDCLSFFLLMCSFTTVNHTSFSIGTDIQTIRIPWEWVLISPDFTLALADKTHTHEKPSSADQLISSVNANFL